MKKHLTQQEALMKLLQICSLQEKCTRDAMQLLKKWGVGEDINTVDIKDPIVGFVFSNKGLMYNLTIEGSKFTKISRE